MVTSNLAHKTTPIEPEIAINENPVKWCTVALSDVVARGKRLEASVFDVEAKQAWALIVNRKYGWSFLGGDSGIISSAYYPGRFKRVYCEKENGEAFFLPSQMEEIYPKAEKYISALTKCNLGELRLSAKPLYLHALEQLELFL